jgi:predicted dienelactone hydrolase
MKRIMSLWILGTVMSCLFACNPAPEILLDATKTIPQASTIAPEATAAIPQVTRTAIWFAAASPTTSNVSVSFPFSERGPYWTGNRVYTFVDESRNGRRIEVQIYYPALKVANEQGGIITRNAAPDLSGAPYPLILTGPDTGGKLLQSHLASHGFIMAIVRYPEYYYSWDFGVIDFPLDMLFVLDQISSNSLEGLMDVIDSDHVGVVGYSWEGFYTQMLSGVRIDPENYLSFCKQVSAMELEISSEYRHYVCNLSKKWDEFTAHVGDEITVSDDGLWQPITDERIRALMPMAEYGTWLYGERGLAMADRPIFIIAPTEDEYIPYPETVYVFEHLKTPEKYLVSFIGKTHLMVEEYEQAARVRHFVTAFFGYYLQGREEYARYFSEDFVSQFDDLFWGVYPDK